MAQPRIAGPVPTALQHSHMLDVQPWKKFARRWTVVTAWLVLLTGIDIAAVRLTREWTGWDRLDPWTALIPMLTGLAAFSTAILACWGWSARPEMRRTRGSATAVVLGCFPSVYAAAWRDGQLGGSVLELVAAFALAGTAVVLLFTVLATVGRLISSGVDSWRRRRGLPTLEDWLTSWMLTRPPLQRIVAVLSALAALWLALTTLVPDIPANEPGIIGIVLSVLVHLGRVADDLSTGIIAGAVLLWFQASPAWQSDREAPLPPPSPAPPSPPGHTVQAGLVGAVLGSLATAAALALVRRQIGGRGQA